MSPSPRPALFFVLLALGLPTACAVPTVYAAPATHAAATPPAEAALRVEAEPVVDLLPLLVAEAPKLTATTEMGERRQHARLPDPRSKAARMAVADVAGGRWNSGSGGAELRLEADGAVAREIAQIQQRRKREFFAGLRRLVRNLSLTPPQLEALKETEPGFWLQLTEPASRSGVELASVLTPAQWRQIEESGATTIPPERFKDADRKVLRSFIQKGEALLKAARATLPGAEPEPPVDVERLLSTPLSFSVRPESNGEPYGYLAIGLGTGGGGRPPMLNGGFPEGPAGMSAMITGTPRFEGPGTRWLDASGKWGDNVPAGEKVGYKLSGSVATWGEAVLSAAEQLGIAVVAEDATFLGFRNLAFLRREVSGTLPEVLDQLSKSWGYQWRLKDGVYEFRNAAWYQDRELEPPATLLKRARLARKEGKLLDLEWLAAAALVPGPCQTRLYRHVPTAFAIRSAPEFLQLYAALSTEQREALKPDGDGLGLAKLSVATQQPLFRKAVVRMAPAWGEAMVARARLRVLKGPQGVRLLVASGEATAGFELELPSAQGPQGLGGFGGGFGGGFPKQ